MKCVISSAAYLLALAMPATTLAQSFPENVPEAKFQFGPLGLTPRIAVKNIGVDTNPLNQSDTPRRDLSASVVPGLDSTLRIGPGRLISRAGLEWNYFKESRTERTLNLNQEGRAELLLNRVMPFVAGSYLRTRQRPNLEIDLRVQQLTTIAGAGTGLRLGSRLRVDLEGRRARFEFGKGSHGDRALADALDRKVETASAVTRLAITPLTTFMVRSEMRRDRFTTSRFRNSNSVTVLPGFELKPTALVAGSVAVGFRRFDALDRTVPDFSGIVAKIDAKYVMREATQFAVIAERDIDYSIEESQPYFVMSGATLSVTQIVGTDWYMAGRLGRSRLAYRDFLPKAPTIAAALERRDRIDTYGVGIGRLLGTDVRIGVDVDRVSRKSVVASHQYKGFRVGGSISYGF